MSHPGTAAVDESCMDTQHAKKKRRKSKSGTELLPLLHRRFRSTRVAGGGGREGGGALKVAGRTDLTPLDLVF